VTPTETGSRSRGGLMTNEEGYIGTGHEAGRKAIPAEG
jgi:hypothetical protein